MFQVGQQVCYGSSGVCEVTAIGPLKMCGVSPEKQYYTLQNLFNGETIYTPIDTKVPMRPLITPQQANELIEAIPKLTYPTVEARNSTELDSRYRELFHFDRTIDLAALLKMLYAKKNTATRGRRMNSTDERIFHQAQTLLFQELSVALSLPLNQVENYIEQRLNRTVSAEPVV